MSNNIIIIPTVTYINPYIDKKKKVYSENKNKSGIYRFNNTETNKYYVGSSSSLSCRFG